MDVRILKSMSKEANYLYMLRILFLTFKCREMKLNMNNNCRIHLSTCRMKLRLKYNIFFQFTSLILFVFGFIQSYYKLTSSLRGRRNHTKLSRLCTGGKVCSIVRIMKLNSTENMRF